MRASEKDRANTIDSQYFKQFNYSFEYRPKAATDKHAHGGGFDSKALSSEHKRQNHSGYASVE